MGIFSFMVCLLPFVAFIFILLCWSRHRYIIAPDLSDVWPTVKPCDSRDIGRTGGFSSSSDKFELS